ncbi:MAG: PD-(D/E)XK nuclease family protein [Acidobacteriota bacterium]|nr:PD-(D/E)XK nuclease family protein [Acidobacteriota bacterium]
MGSMTPELERKLADGSLLIAASDRTARSLRASFHRHRLNEGLSAWSAPEILDWGAFIRRTWEELAEDDAIVLTAAQEQMIWAEIAGQEDQIAVQLESNLYRLASLAAGAYALICNYSPNLLSTSARNGWDQDAAAFSRWLTAMEKRSRRDHLVCAHALPLRVADWLQKDKSKRAPLFLVGFDRILPTQRLVLDAWGIWEQEASSTQTSYMDFFVAPDEAAELDVCAQWCQTELEANPAARLMIVTQDTARLRGQLERALLRGTDAAFEFSLGVPLSNAPLLQSTMLALRWLDNELDESEVDTLLAGGRICTNDEEVDSLLLYMRRLRSHQLERTTWPLHAFLRKRSPLISVAESFAQRMQAAQTRLHSLQARPRLPREWAEAIPALLQSMAWPGYRTLNSEEEQARRAWEDALENCASSSFDGKEITWKEFLRILDRSLADTLFTPESLDAPILIVGPAESAGLTADAVWFLGADERNWPASGSSHPFLPLAIQKQAGMPHATAQLDWDLAARITKRLLSSAKRISFSYARQREGMEMRPSGLVTQLVCTAQPLPNTLRTSSRPTCITNEFDDESRIPFPLVEHRGGASVLSAQSQCPFRAFATYRLDAKDWQPALAGLTPAKRGQLLHDTLKAIWSGPPHGIRTLNDLKGLRDRRTFIEGHVHHVMDAKVEAELRERMPKRYLALESARLVRLLDEWLSLEVVRAPFTVKETEAKKSACIGGLALRLRLDRVDILQDDSALIVDYKSGAKSEKAWDLPRPEDVQLPLYANYGLEPDSNIGGLVFAKVRSGNCEFAGRVKDARATLLPELNGRSRLVQTPLTDATLQDWQVEIEKLADAFLRGRALPDPRQYLKTCEQCGLQTLCRIQEFPPLVEPVADGGSDDD